MVVSLFFLLGVVFLTFIPTGSLALVWSTVGSLQFVLNLLTHMFAHANWGHLLGNYMFVFPYALYVEYRVGWKKFCGWWLFAGFTALALDMLVVILGQQQYGVIGSSGAAFGITAAALWLVKENKWAALACRALALYFICDQAWDAWNAFANPFGWYGGVAYAAHLGGILGGIYLAQRQRSLEARQSASQGVSAK